MKNFKFFSEEDDDELELDSSPSWIFDSYINLQGLDYLIVTEQYMGIRSFLNQFPNNFVAVVKSITCNGRIHTGMSQYADGWGFDITSDLLTIEYYRFTDQEENDNTNHTG